MHRHLSPRSLRRAKWHAALTEALAEADRLLVKLAADGSFPEETARLRLRIETVKSELAQLNRMMTPGEDRVVSRTWPDMAPADIGRA